MPSELEDLKQQLAETEQLIEELAAGLEECLDPELTRVQLVQKIRRLASMADEGVDT
jgi:hypothetical protein